MKLTLKDLTTPRGIKHVAEVTKGTTSYFNDPSRASELKGVVQRVLEKDPRMASMRVKVVPNLPNAFYNWKKNEIILGVTHPAILAHEIEHAKSLQQDSLYRKILSTTQKAIAINHLAAIPTTLALCYFLDDREKRRAILQTLSIIAGASAVPVIGEEIKASTRAMLNNPNPKDTARVLFPALMSHVVRKAIPPLIYQAGRRL